MLRVSRTSEHDMPTLLLEGKLLVPWVGEVRTMVDHRQKDRPCRINLGAVDFVDREGARFLAELRRDGIELVNCSPFIASLIVLHDQ